MLYIKYLYINLQAYILYISGVPFNNKYMLVPGSVLKINTLYSYKYYK